MIGLREKLSLGFGGLLAIILIIGGESIVQFGGLGQSIDVILRENYRSVVACQEMKEALERMDSGILFVLMGYGEEGRKLIQANEERFEKALGVELGNITLPGEGEKAAALKGLFVRFREALQRIQAVPPAAQRSRDAYFREVLPLFQKSKDTADDILRMNQDNMNDANERARRQAASSQQRMYIFLSLGVVIAIAFIFFTGRWILRPIRMLIHSAEEIRGGNLDLVLRADSKDEIGSLAKAFNDMAAGLREYRDAEEVKLIRTRQATQETLDNLSEAVAILDLEGKVEISTETARTLFGIKNGASLGDLPYSELSALFRVVAAGAPDQVGKRQQVIRRSVNGEERRYSFDAAPIRKREGQLTGWVLIMREVTKEATAHVPGVNGPLDAMP